MIDVQQDSPKALIDKKSIESLVKKAIGLSIAGAVIGLIAYKLGQN
jgi:hypothetical protein